MNFLRTPEYIFGSHILFDYLNFSEIAVVETSFLNKQLRSHLLSTLSAVVCNRKVEISDDSMGKWIHDRKIKLNHVSFGSDWNADGNGLNGLVPSLGTLSVCDFSTCSWCYLSKKLFLNY